MLRALRSVTAAALILLTVYLLEGTQIAALVNEGQLGVLWLVNRARVPVSSDIRLVTLPRPDGNDGEQYEATRTMLTNALAYVLAANPKAVAVDVGSGPQIGQTLTGFERKLLDSGWNRKVCYGVTNIRGSAPEDWLGDARYAGQAANMLALNPELGLRQMVLEIRFTDAGSILPGLARCLAGYIGGPLPSVPRFLNAMVNFAVRRNYGVFTAYTFPVNFAILPELRRQTIDWRELAEPTSRRVNLANTIVLIGYEDKSDTLSIPGQTEPVFGLEAHAAAFYTITSHPLFSLTPLGRLLADGGLALLFVVIVSHLHVGAHKNADQKGVDVDEFAIAIRIAFALGTATIAASILLSLCLGLFVPEILPIAAGAFLHPYAERITGRALRIMFLSVVLAAALIGSPDQSAPRGDGTPPQAKVISVAATVMIQSSAGTHFLHSGQLPFELRSGDRVRCTSGFAQIEVYGLKVDGRPVRVWCKESEFVVPTDGGLITLIQSIVEENFQLLGRR